MNTKVLKNALTCLSCLGVGAVAVSAIRDTTKHTDDNLSIKQYVKAYWKDYIPTIILGTATTASIITNHVITVKEMRSLGTFALGTTALLADYKNEIRDQLGDEQLESIVKGVAKKREDGIQQAAVPLIERMGLINVEEDIQEEGNILFYDEFSDTWFRSSLYAVRNAMYHFNRNFAMSGCSSIDEFYTFLGIKPTAQWPKDLYGFGNNIIEDGIFWIDFELVESETKDGEKYYIIYFTFAPAEYDEDELTYVEYADFKNRR